MKQELLRKATSLPLFSFLPDTLVVKILSGAITVTVPRGRTIALQGDQADNLSFIVDGMVKMYRLFPDGNEILIRIMKHGDIITADLGTGQYERHHETFEAFKDTQLITISKSHFQTCMADHPEIALSMLSIANQQTQTLVDEITLIKRRNLTQKLATVFVEMCPEVEGSANFTLPYEKTLIAARIGTTRESLSRTFAELKKLGVEVNRTHVTIENVDQLKRFAGNISRTREAGNENWI